MSQFNYNGDKIIESKNKIVKIYKFNDTDRFYKFS